MSSRSGDNENGSNLLHYLGPPGTYSHQVAIDLIPHLQASSSRQVILQPCDTIKSTIEQASKRAKTTKQTNWALLPYENNSNGPVSDSYDILFALDPTLPVATTIVAEYHLPVSHSLLCSKNVYKKLKGKEDAELDLTKIDVVSSHSQALGQCSHFFATKLRQKVKRVETTSTGEAARLLTEGQGMETDILQACISSKVCAQAEVYDLAIIQEDIQNSSKNVTRFLLLESLGGAESTPFNNLELDVRWRSILRVETTASSRSLGLLLANLTWQDEMNFDCHIRAIERRAIKDAVDSKGDQVVSNREGRWPYMYLIEIEASTSVSSPQDYQTEERPLKRARNGDADEDSLDFPELLASILVKASLDSDFTSIKCLGVWQVKSSSMS